MAIPNDEVFWKKKVFDLWSNLDIQSFGPF